MEKNLQLITEPEKLMAWLDNNDLLLTLYEKEAKVLLGYLEGHDYAIGVVDKKMVRVDICDENYEYEDYTIDEFIDTVCEWNYDLILHAEAKKDDPKDFQEYCEFQKKYDSLKADERVLDRLFEKTRHAKEIDEVATALVEAFISNLEGKGNVDKAVATIAERIKDYSTDKRGR